MQYLFFLAAAYGIIILLFYLLQRHLIYFPEYTNITPTEAGLPEMQEVSIQTSDQLALKAWHCPAKQPSLPTIVYYHGNAGHIGYRASIVKPYIKAGFGMLLLTYRGYSGNPGKPSEEGLYQDARASLKFLKVHGVPYSSMVLLGESIGSAVAIQMATENPVGAIILQAPFTSMAEVGAFHYPFVPVRWLIKERFNSLEKAADVHVPVCIIHGQNDHIIPPAMSQKLYDVFSEPKALYIIPYTGHNDLFEPIRAIRFINMYRTH